MPTTSITTKSLHLIPGVADDFDSQIASAVRDCRERPGLNKERVVKVELRITPHPDDVDDVNVVPVITSKSPARKLDSVRARSNGRNQLQFDFEESEL